MLVWLSRTLMLAALCLAGWSVWHLLIAPTPVVFDPPLIVDWPESNLGELNIGSHEVVVRVTNPAGLPRRIIGMVKGCGLNGCVKPNEDEPVAVPPGGTVSYPCRLDILRTGPFETPIILYLEDNGVREARYTLRGVAVTPGGKRNDRDSNAGP